MRSLDSLILEIADLPSASAVIVADDPTGDLTQAALATGAPVYSIDADYTRAHAAREFGAVVAGIDGPLRIDAFLTSTCGPFHSPGVTLIGEMPKARGRLDYIARSAASAGCDRIVLGGNNKHLSRSMNEVLGESFNSVAASRGRGKFRCLTASGPRPVAYEPARANGFTAFGGVFSGTKEDYGAASLVDVLLSSGPLSRVLDLGCGNGSVSKRLLDAGADVTATDADADAVLSAREVLSCEVTWDDAGSGFPNGSFDTVALNPPFHDRAGLDPTLVQRLLDASRRLLGPEGQLVMVHNSHLRYRGEVEARFGTVEEVARNAKFTVLRAKR